ncbi:MAG: hypothetical protein M3357_06225 [Actinomycetota bacterium]|nr:hypothetical protein [Actinomycetota bacterium]
MRTGVENRQDRLALAEDAGWGRISATSVLAGILVGYGAFAILAGVTAAVLGALDINVDLTGADLQRTGTVGGIVLGVVLFMSWYFGAYTAGRMARRAGLSHGLVVFFIGVLVAVAAASAVEALGATDDVVASLERLGVPTTAEQWSDIGTVAGIASLVGMLAGCLLGGAAGERWHAKLVARALDPGVGPEALARTAENHAVRAKNRRLRRRRDVDLTSAPPENRKPQPAPPEEQKKETAASKARSEEKSTAS